MKTKITLISALLLASGALVIAGDCCKAQNKKHYEATWESLHQYEIPEWMKDSKFGIFIHWGPNSVAERHTDWYPRWMYLDKGNFDNHTGEQLHQNPHPAFAYHKEKFGDQKQVGYKDLIPKFTMDQFDASEWATLFKKSGAQYVIPVAEHHDGFALYESSVTPWNAVEMGPKRDVFKELIDAVKAEGMVAGASSHLAFNWFFYNIQDYFDNSDPKYVDLYGPKRKMGDPVSPVWLENVWWPRTKEIIDKYQPDILWFDFFLDREDFVPYHKRLAAYYYNSGEERGTEVVLQTKNLRYESYQEGTHMLDLERSRSDHLRESYWQTDTSIGANSWYYNVDWIAKPTGNLIAELVDIVSKNGCLLLNIGPKWDGTIPNDQQQTLLEMGAWLDVNGEAIYGSRHWVTYGEGPTKTVTGHLSEERNKSFTAQDIRFTIKDDFLYAFTLATPSEDIVIHSLAEDAGEVLSVELLGHDGEIEFKQSRKELKIRVPQSTKLKYAWTFKIELKCK